jgi:hypothetical protein
MDLVSDPALVEKVAEKFVAKLALTDYHLRTGFIGTPLLLPALSRIGRDDLAYKMLLHKDYPSWGYEVAGGATTMWERWNSITPDGSFGSVDMNSFNHYAYGAVGDWMFQNIGGLSAIEPGYKRSRIAPAPGGNLTKGSGRLKTVYDLLSSRWSSHEDAFDLKVTVPVNTIAEVHVDQDPLGGHRGWPTGRRRQRCPVPPDGGRGCRVRGRLGVLQLRRQHRPRQPRRRESSVIWWRALTLRARRRRAGGRGRSRPLSKPPGPPTWQVMRKVRTNMWTGPGHFWATSVTGPPSRSATEH